jgi:hypothetical protein
MGVRTQLTVDQRQLYEHLKQEIHKYFEKGVSAFELVAEDMLMIRNQRLYREEYDTFEEFCRETLLRSKTHVNRMIQAGDVIKRTAGSKKNSLPGQ